MVVLKTYYEIIDRPSIEVNKCWKVCHIILYIIAAITGLSTYIIFNDLEFLFGENCILYPTIIFSSVLVNVDTGEFLSVKAMTRLNELNGNITNVTTTINIDQSKTIWGNEDLCNYYKFMPIVSFLIGTIFVTFYCMCPRGGSRRAQAGIKAPWNIVPFSLVMTGIFAIIIFYGYNGMMNGINAFCAQFEEQLNVTECNRDIGNYSLIDEKYYGHAYYDILVLRALYCACFITWTFAFVLLIARSCCCVIDFKIMKLTISTLKNDDQSFNEDNNLLATNRRTGSLNEIDTEIFVTETEGLLTKPVNRRKSLPQVFF